MLYNQWDILWIIFFDLHPDYFPFFNTGTDRKREPYPDIVSELRNSRELCEKGAPEPVSEHCFQNSPEISWNRSVPAVRVWLGYESVIAIVTKNNVNREVTLVRYVVTNGRSSFTGTLGIYMFIELLHHSKSISFIFTRLIDERNIT